MLTFRLTLIASILLMIGALADLLGYVQNRALDTAAETAVRATMDAASTQAATTIRIFSSQNPSWQSGKGAPQAPSPPNISLNGLVCPISAFSIGTVVQNAFWIAMEERPGKALEATI
jgi:hypothetical protein